MNIDKLEKTVRDQLIAEGHTYDVWIESAYVYVMVPIADKIDIDIFVNSFDIPDVEIEQELVTASGDEIEIDWDNDYYQVNFFPVE